MKKYFKTLLVLGAVVILAVVMSLTVPDKKAHKDAMMKAVKEYVDEEAGEKFGDNVLTSLGKGVVLKTIEMALNSKLKVNDYVLLNTTHVRLKGEDQLLSVGLLGTVITFDKEMLREKLEEAVKVKEEADQEKAAAKQNARDLKKLQKEQRKREKALEKEQKKAEKAARKEQKRKEKEARRQQKQLEKEAESN